jgi:hypothetical protein
LPPAAITSQPSARVNTVGRLVLQLATILTSCFKKYRSPGCGNLASGEWPYVPVSLRGLRRMRLADETSSLGPRVRSGPASNSGTLLATARVHAERDPSGHRFSSESAEFAIVCAKEASPPAAHRRPRFGNRDGKTGASGRSGGGSGNGRGGLRSCASEPVRSSPSGGRRRPKADAPRRCGIRSRRPRARHLQRGGTLLPMAKFTWKNPPEPGAPRPCAGEIPGVLESLAAFQSSRTPMAIIDTGGQGSE